MRSYLGVLAVGLCGCSFLTPPIEKPVIEDHSGVLGTFATVAERRMVVTKKTYNTEHADNPGYNSTFCAEPPPDSTQSIASSLTAALRADASHDKSKQSVSAEAARELMTTAKSMFNRSQGVQLFRDGVYNLCQAQLNKAINEGSYEKMFSELLGVSAKLIADEIAKSPNIDVAKAISAAQEAQSAQEQAAASVITLKTLKSEAESERRTADAARKTAQAASKEAQDAADEKLKEVELAVTRAEAAATRAEAAAGVAK
jgi:sulfur relay (sulfurtransferase) DsrF/TusC family protein